MELFLNTLVEFRHIIFISFLLLALKEADPSFITSNYLMVINKHNFIMRVNRHYICIYCYTSCNFNNPINSLNKNFFLGSKLSIAFPIYIYAFIYVEFLNIQVH